MKKMKSRQKLFLRKNKKFYGLFFGLFAFILLIDATLSWTSYSEWVKNHTQSNPESIAVSVTEKFIQGSAISFEADTEKSVKVKNISNRKALIRVHFRESLVPFAIDTSDGEGGGNGNLKVYKKTDEAEINVNDPSGWKEGSLLSADKKDGDTPLYYKAVAPIVKDEVYTGEAKRNAPTRPASLGFFQWQMNPAVEETPKTGITTPYWVFDGEYYYYSQVLEGGETTAIDLLQAVRLANVHLPNKYKNALYNIEVEAEGVVPSESGLKTWTENEAYLSMYKEDNRFVQ